MTPKIDVKLQSVEIYIISNHWLNHLANLHRPANFVRSFVIFSHWSKLFIQWKTFEQQNLSGGQILTPG